MPRTVFNLIAQSARLRLSIEAPFEWSNSFMTVRLKFLLQIYGGIVHSQGVLIAHSFVIPFSTTNAILSRIFLSSRIYEFGV